MRFFNIKPNLTLADLDQMLNTYPLDRLQIDNYIDDASLKLLNEEFYPKRPEVSFRVYSNPFKDMSFLSWLTNVKDLCINCMYDAVENMDVLENMNKLEELTIDIYNQKDFSFLDKVTNNLKRLTLNVNKTSFDANKLLRFGDLEYLYIQNIKKNVDAIGELTKLKHLRLKGVTSPGLNFINPLKNLEELEISGGKNDFSALYGNTCIRRLTLCSIRGLDNLDVISFFPNLESVSARYMSDITALPDLSGAKVLKKIGLTSMKNLTDLSSAEFAPALDSFYYNEVSKNLNPSDTLPILRNPTVQVCRVFFASTKKNKEADTLRLQYGKRDR